MTVSNIFLSSNLLCTIIYYIYYLFDRCFLRSHFQWFFICPVIIILAINMIFLLMASVILWKQKNKKLTKMEENLFFGWLKSVISLAVIMGLTWMVGGVVIVAREELAPLAWRL